MSEREIFNVVAWSFAGVAVVVFLVLMFVTAPYGRHARPGWGPTLPNRWAWILMEFVSPLGMAAWFVMGGRFDPVSIIFLTVWQVHYCQRAFIYPFLIRHGSRSMPVSIVLSGLTFNLFNTYINGRWLFSLSTPYPASWIFDPRFIAGIAMFAVGFAMNLHSDHLLRGLSAPGETGYRIPRGGMFRYVSCPNYLGEMIEWIGWAVMTWSPPTAIFALWTFANLGPRARSTHRWYHETFADYPDDRKALIPYVW